MKGIHRYQNPKASTSRRAIGSIFVMVGTLFPVLILLSLLGNLPLVGHAADSDLLIADFEGTNYGAWTVIGDAFGSAPARGTLPNQMEVKGFAGGGLVNSYCNGDKTTGRLTSPEFTIARRYITFLIGGGGWEGKTCVNLIVGGRTARSANGSNTKPGGSEALSPAFWEVSDLVGQTARLEIVDEATGGWGHINVDQIVQTDRTPTGILSNPTRPLEITRRYLNLPVKNGAPVRRVALLVDGQPAREFEIELADATPDFWVFLDLAPFRGRTAVLKVDRLPSDSAALASIEQADTIKGAENLYREALRPQFHFTSRRGWNNDPNGLVFYRGEYHLYYQHNPYGWPWGNMHWGHAVSSDLVHWKELPIALYPQRFGDWAFSGSAVVDWKNTGGFQQGKDPALVAAYTSTGRGECIVFSNDRGRTFSEYAGNPVVRHEGRDPRILWHESTRQWVMALYDELPGEPDEEKRRGITFHTSPDLKNWTYQSRIGGFFECPDLFELPVDGRKDQTKWVLTAASSEYRLGRFDGRIFTPETPKLPGHRGSKFYAAQTYSDIPARDGRCIQIGWSGIATPGMPFNQMMAFPCELTLRTTPDGPRLAWQPVRELATLHRRKVALKDATIDPGRSLLPKVSGDLFDIETCFEPAQAQSVSIIIRGMPVTYDASKSTLASGGITNSLPLVDGKISLRILADRTSLEVFGNKGILYMPMNSGFQPASPPLELVAQGGAAKLVSLTAHELKSAWKK